MKNTTPAHRVRSHAALVAAITLSFPALGAAASAPPAQAVVEGALGAQLDALAEQARSEGFHGVLLVAKEGKEAKEPKEIKENKENA